MIVGNICRDCWGMQFKELEGGGVLEATNATKHVELVNTECDIWGLWVDGEFVDEYNGLKEAIRYAESKVAFRMKIGEIEG